MKNPNWSEMFEGEIIHNSQEVIGKYDREPMTDRAGRIRAVAENIGAMTAKKNAAYGDSVTTSAEILAILYPDGVSPEDYGDMLLIVRCLDKFSRIANDKHAFGESPWRDIAGYGVMGAEIDERGQG